MKGWISLHRQIQDHWLWSDKPFSKGQAWVDMLLMVNHDAKKILLGNMLIDVERGEFITSEVKLADRWGWSRKKVREFLSVLEADGMLIKKATTKYTSITLVRYEEYQHQGTAKEQQKNSKRTAKEQQRNTNNNVNNLNNVNKKTYSDIPELNKAWIDFIDMRKKIKAPLTDRALEIAKSKLDKLASNDKDRIEILNQSTMNSWKSVFPIKKDFKNKKQVVNESDYDKKMFSYLYEEAGEGR